MHSQSAVLPSLAGRAVFITGGGSGVGAAIRVNTLSPGCVLTGCPVHGAGIIVDAGWA